MKLISLILPVFNEQSGIAENLKCIFQTLTSLTQYQFEVLVVDDGSTDQTAKVVEEIERNEPRLKFISFTRNFGKEAAIEAGLKNALGHAAIVMDSDLQHPPQLIGEMLQYWEKGIPVVEAIKENRGQESFFNRLSAQTFYFLLKSLSGQSLAGHSDFKLLDREVMEAYLALPEKQKFFRGLVHWLGYVSIQIPFSVPPRTSSGGSRWSKLKLIKYAIKNITIFSSIPLSMVSGLGLFTLLFGFIFGFISLWQKLEGQALSGFTTVNLLIVIIGGSILFCLGIVGHYLALIYDEIKSRPQFVIRPKK